MENIYIEKKDVKEENHRGSIVIGRRIFVFMIGFYAGSYRNRTDILDCLMFMLLWEPAGCESLQNVKNNAKNM